MTQLNYFHMEVHTPCLVKLKTVRVLPVNMVHCCILPACRTQARYRVTYGLEHLLLSDCINMFVSATKGSGQGRGQDARGPIGPNSPVSPAALRSQVSSLMSTPQRAGNEYAPRMTSKGLRSLNPTALPGLWKRGSLPSGISLQQQLSSLGQQYLPEDNLAQLMPYGSALNLRAQIEDTQSVSGKYTVYSTC